MNAFQRAFQGVFPGWALKRQLARVHLRHVNSLLLEHVNDQSDRLSRRDRHLPVDQDVGRNRAALLSTARNLIATNSFAVGAVNSITGNIIGRGMKPESAIILRSGESKGLPDQAANERVESVWKGWARKADLAGRQSFNSIQRQLCTERWTTNDVFLRRYTVSNRIVPLGLQVVPAELLSDKNDQSRGIKMGVEYSRGAPIAYHFYKREGSIEIERVEARDVIHLFKPHRPGALRGLSPMGTVWDKFDALRRYLNHELTRAQIASAFVFLHKTAGPALTGLKSGKQPENADDRGNRLIDLYEGGGLYLKGNQGDALESVAPAIQSTAFDPFVRLVLRSIATGLGISYEILARDWTKTNFSSSRSANLEDRRQWEPEQEEFIDVVLMVVWEWFVEAAQIAGVAPFTLQRNDWPVVWTPQGWQWIDPLKEVNAIEKAISIGVDNAVDASRRLGRDAFENVRKKAALERFAADQGTKLGSPGSSGSGDSSNVDDEDEEKEEEDGGEDESGSGDDRGFRVA